MTKHIVLGKTGEELAAQFLILKGYEIVDRNWRYKRAELDIVAKKDEKLIFIEVKTRSSDYFGSPEQFVHFRKRQLLSRAAGAYILSHNHDWLIRYDIIAILYNEDGTYSLTHFEDAFF
ncbi:MAG: YraN family protein [Saprospiraceae bacterium]